MRSYRNPFRARTAEQLGESVVFLRNFGPGVLSQLPESIWDRPVLLRSAPGGGKTSLMRLFSIESLSLVASRPEEFPDLHDRLIERGALAEEGPTHMGVLIRLDRDFRSLLDLDLPADQLLQLFYTLLDARIMMSMIRSAVEARGASSPKSLQLVPLDSLSEAEDLAEPLGGLQGEGLWAQARERERAVLRPLDSLIPRSESPSSGVVIPQLHSLRLLSVTRLAVDGRELPERPLVMFDDGHELGTEQRQALVDLLADRNLQVARWYSERFEALSSHELLVGSTEGRDFELVQLEQVARASPRSYESFVLDVANRRSRAYLQDYAEVEQSFTELITIQKETRLQGRDDEILETLREGLAEIAEQHSRYRDWWTARKAESGYEGAVRLRALAIVIAADQLRTKTELFELEDALPEAELEKRQKRVMSAAEHFLANDFGLPYYSGPSMLARLGAENMEQFLRLAGEVFEQMLGKITLKRHPRLDAVQQDRIAHAASEIYWRELPQRVPRGTLVRQLVEAIVRLSQADTFRPSAPYAPGVTGTALLMGDRERLLDPGVRKEIEGAEELFDAIGAGVAYNVLSVQLDYAVKNRRVMVIYLNRLVCPRFKLPVNRGGFRERSLEVMASWMTGERKGHEPEPQVHDVAQMEL